MVMKREREVIMNENEDITRDYNEREWERVIREKEDITRGYKRERKREL